MNTSITNTLTRLMPAGFLRNVAIVAMLLATAKSQAGWETLADSSDFSSKAAFENAYDYNYGYRAQSNWGRTHNGYSWMDASQVVVPGNGNVRLDCTKNGAWFGGNLYQYESGTFRWKKQVIINAARPVWDISIDMAVPYQSGTWPAFWLTPTNNWNCEDDVAEAWGLEGIRHGILGNPPGHPDLTGNTKQWSSGTQTPESVFTGADRTTWHNYRQVIIMVNDTDVEFHQFVDGVHTGVVTKANFVNNPLEVLMDYETFRPGQTSSGGDTTFTGTVSTWVSNLTIRDLYVYGIANTGPIANGTYRLVNKLNNSSVLNVNGAQTGNGTDCILNQPSGAANERWFVVNLGEHNYALFGRQSGRTLEIPGASTANGTQLDIWNYIGQNNEKWTVEDAAGGYKWIKNVNSGKFMCPSGGSTANGTGIIQWDWTGSLGQQWLFQAQ
jgi:hypothetical protein